MCRGSGVKQLIDPVNGLHDQQKGEGIRSSREKKDQVAMVFRIPSAAMTYDPFNLDIFILEIYDISDGES